MMHSVVKLVRILQRRVNNVRVVLVGLLMLCGSPAYAQPVNFLTGVETGVSVRVQVEPLGMDEFSTTLDFGRVPAVKIDPTYKYMNAMNRQYIAIKNLGVDDLSISSVHFEIDNTDEPSTPFDTCSNEQAKFTVAAGTETLWALCYFPTVASASLGQVVFKGDGDEFLFAIPIKGSGRVLGEGETPPFGAILNHNDFLNINVNKTSARLAGGSVIIGGLSIAPIDGSTVVLGKCRVSINGGAEIPNTAIDALYANNLITVRNTANKGFNSGVKGDEINVGQHVMLGVSVNCAGKNPAVVQAVRWVIAGQSVQNYTEDLRLGKIVTSPLTNLHLRRKNIDFYWQKPGAHTVTAKVSYRWAGQLFTANAARKLIVEINKNDIDRQMEDFFLWNHRGRVLFQHTGWHVANPAGRCFSSAGDDFFLFHRSMLKTADDWRKKFGPYPAIVIWKGSRPLPAANDVNHRGRNGGARQALIPSFYTVAGGVAISPCAGKKALKGPNGFASLNQLAIDMEGLWHGLGHRVVGGEMGRIETSPKDPIFFRWHKYIDSVAKIYKP